MGFSTAEIIGLIIAGTGTAVSVASSIQQGEQKKAADDYNAQVAQNNAAYQEEAAMQQADKIRKVGIEQQAEATAGAAASGIDVGEGSAVDITRKIGQNTEQDAFNALLNGQRAVQSGDQQSSLLRTAGSNATNNSYIGAGATILGSAASTYNATKGWKTSSSPSSSGGANYNDANSNGWT